MGSISCFKKPRSFRKEHTQEYHLEYQSNEFAAAFLMPEEDYKRVMDQYTEGNIVDTSAVAKYFHVSIDTAANRGKGLGYLRW